MEWYFIALPLALCIWVVWLEQQVRRRDKMLETLYWCVRDVADNNAEIYRDEDGNVRIKKETK